MKYKPVCIKCKKKYDSDEPDDFYCEDCNTTRLEIAKEVDKKIASRPPKREKMSGIQHYDSLTKIKGFVNAKDLGL